MIPYEVNSLKSLLIFSVLWVLAGVEKRLDEME